jgi:hypothetical protein
MVTDSLNSIPKEFGTSFGKNTDCLDSGLRPFSQTLRAQLLALSLLLPLIRSKTAIAADLI